MLSYTRCNIVIFMAATAWLMLSFSSCIVCGFDSHTGQISPPPPGSVGVGISLGTPEKYDIRIKSAHDTGTEGQHQPRSCSHQNHYVTSGIAQHDLDVYSCVLMKDATTLNIFYGGISFQHLATVLISVFTLCYVPGLIFCGPSCIKRFLN